MSFQGYEQFPSDQYTDGTGGGNDDYDIVTDVGNGVAIQVVYIILVYFFKVWLLMYLYVCYCVMNCKIIDVSL